MKVHTSNLRIALLAFSLALLGARASGHEHEGQADAPKGHLAQSAADKEIVAQQAPAYPLKTCLVSGDKLGGDMGAPVDYLYNGRLIRFCCKDCIKKFEAKAAEYLAQLDKAAKENAGAKGDTGAVNSAVPVPADPHAGHGGSGHGCCN